MDEQINHRTDCQEISMSHRERMHVARDAAGLLAAAWADDQERVDLMVRGLGEHERVAFMASLAEFTLMALQTPSETPPGTFHGQIAGMLDQEVDD